MDCLLRMYSWLLHLPGIMLPWFVLCCYNKHHYQMQFNEERVDLAYTSVSQSWGNSGKKPGVETWSRSHEEIPLAHSFMASPATFLMQPRPTCPGMRLSKAVWTLPNQSLIEKMPPKTDLQNTWWRPFSQRRVPLSRFVNLTKRKKKKKEN